MRSEKVCVIKNLDKEWFIIINSIRHMRPEDARAALEDMYERIPVLFGFPKKVLVKNDYGDEVFVLNPDWKDAKDWIDYHAGWFVNDRVSDGVALIHPIRRLKEKFELNAEFFK